MIWSPLLLQYQKAEKLMHILLGNSWPFQETFVLFPKVSLFSNNRHSQYQHSSCMTTVLLTFPLAAGLVYARPTMTLPHPCLLCADSCSPSCWRKHSCLKRHMAHLIMELIWITSHVFSPFWIILHLGMFPEEMKISAVCFSLAQLRA